MDTKQDITGVLQAWSRGDPAALDQLIPLVDCELRRLAHSYMSRERIAHTLQTTALVNEALIRFIDAGSPNWESRRHFYAIVARRMRQILVEHAREQLTQKRGMRAEHVNVSSVFELSTEKSQELLLLDAALTKLGQLDERKSKVVEYRYFGGFTVPEIAEILEVSTATVEREWKLARSWLLREIRSETAGDATKLD
jgi:RNA polymerase sigma-70 factor, ECF subfamily